jgi:hypothetical protein
MSDRYHPLNDFDPDRWNARDIKTDYYNTELHRGAFALPNYVYRLLHDGVLLDQTYRRVIGDTIWPPNGDTLDAEDEDRVDIDFSEVEKNGY